MRFVKPSTSGPQERAGGSVHQRPDWLQEWIANQGKYVLLECGHRLDINDRGVMVGQKLGVRQALCGHCGEWREIGKSIGLAEYWQVELPLDTDEPPF